MWITPRILSSIIPRFSAFKNITSLSLHSFSVHHFDDLDIQSCFQHVFATVQKLNLEGPRTTAIDLLLFMCNFRALDDFSISDPEWDHETSGPPAPEVRVLPPLRGTLHLLRVHADSADFVSLLAGLSVAFQRVSLVNCQLPSTTINLLLKRLSSSLKSFSSSSWFISELSQHVSPSSIERQIQAAAFQIQIFRPVLESKKSSFLQEWFLSPNPSREYITRWGLFRPPTYGQSPWISTRRMWEILPTRNISGTSGGWMLNFTGLPRLTEGPTRPWLNCLPTPRLF